MLAGLVEAAAAVVGARGVDEAEPVPFVDGGADDAEPCGELPAGEEFLVPAGVWPSGGGDLLAGGPWLAGPVERVAAVAGARGVDEAEVVPAGDGSTTRPRPAALEAVDAGWTQRVRLRTELLPFALAGQHASGASSASATSATVNHHAGA